MVFIQPTAHALVHLTELPFMVVTFDDVEFVSLERVQVCRGLRQHRRGYVKRHAHG